MGRRRAGARFVPGCYVFPGGAVDPADRNARPATRLDPRIVGKLAVANSAQRAQALAMAAVRETYEETGYWSVKPQPRRPQTIRPGAPLLTPVWLPHWGC